MAGLSEQLLRSCDLEETSSLSASLHLCQSVVYPPASSVISLGLLELLLVPSDDPLHDSCSSASLLSEALSLAVIDAGWLQQP